MKFESYKCDMCPTVKGANNHWFRMREKPNQFGVGAWNAQPVPQEDELHLCSDACVIKKVQSWLSEQQAGSAKEAA